MLLLLLLLLLLMVVLLLSLPSLHPSTLECAPPCPLCKAQGTIVANYPWDGTASGRTFYNGTTDDDTFRYLASTYAQLNPAMAASTVGRGPEELQGW